MYRKIKQLTDEKEKEEIDNDDWVGKVYKNMNSAG